MEFFFISIIALYLITKAERSDVLLFLANAYFTYLDYKLWEICLENRIWENLNKCSTEPIIIMILTIGLTISLPILYVINIKIARKISEEEKNKQKKG